MTMIVTIITNTTATITATTIFAPPMCM
jgi:hypothetical protein